MNHDIKVGDLVETCSLMPGVVMKKNGDDIEVRMLDITEYDSNVYSCCSLSHCGIVKLTPIQVVARLVVGKERLSELYRDFMNEEGEGDYIYETYDKKVFEEYKNLLQ